MAADDTPTRDPSAEELARAQAAAELAIDDDEDHLAALGDRFLRAMDAARGGDIDQAAEELSAILKAEPRLAEPRLELGRILLETGQIDEAAEQAEEAIRILEGGGQWTQDLPENVVLSLAWNLRGEALRQQADQDEVVFGDPGRWQALVEQARAAFAKAAELDADNAHAAYWAGGTDAERLEAEGTDEDSVDEEDLLPPL
ncbi:MAG: tetratricopeptide repeat protein [Alphaproteobacteria bacterium]|nr:tetratricopeptide repeat protein [Alphaproteobacteria bacterium]